MKIFKEIMAILCRLFGTFAYGWAIADLFSGNYETASWILFAVATLFLIGYSVEYIASIDYIELK